MDFHKKPHKKCENRSRGMVCQTTKLKVNQTRLTKRLCKTLTLSTMSYFQNNMLEKNNKIEKSDKSKEPRRNIIFQFGEALFLVLA